MIVLLIGTIVKMIPQEEEASSDISLGHLVFLLDIVIFHSSVGREILVVVDRMLHEVTEVISGKKVVPVLDILLVVRILKCLIMSCLCLHCHRKWSKGTFGRTGLTDYANSYR